MDEVKQIYFKNREQLRDWLKENHDKEKSIWLVHDKFKGGELSYDDIVEEALCFGWIDGQVKKLDEKRTMAYLSIRKKGSIWSRYNKERVEKLIKSGLMTKSGLEVIQRAKDDGSWNSLNQVDDLVVPPQLQKAFAKNKAAEGNYENFSISIKKAILYYIYSAKQEETKKKRIEKILPSLEAGKNPFL